MCCKTSATCNIIIAIITTMAEGRTHIQEEKFDVAFKLRVAVAAESTTNRAVSTANFPSLCYCIRPRFVFALVLFVRLFRVRN